MIEAWQYPALELANESAVPEWLKGKFTTGKGDGLFIETLEGVMEARPCDWIIRGVAGEIYPCKPDIFAATYEPA